MMHTRARDTARWVREGAQATSRVGAAGRRQGGGAGMRVLGWICCRPAPRTWGPGPRPCRRRRPLGAAPRRRRSAGGACQEAAGPLRSQGTAQDDSRQQAGCSAGGPGMCPPLSMSPSPSNAAASQMAPTKAQPAGPHLRDAPRLEEALQHAQALRVALGLHRQHHVHQRHGPKRRRQLLRGY